VFFFFRASFYRYYPLFTVAIAGGWLVLALAFVLMVCFHCCRAC
jgi:hypothetical protein